MLHLGRVYIWLVPLKRWHKLYFVKNPPRCKFFYEYILALGPLRIGSIFSANQSEPDISWAWSPGDGDADTTD